SKRGEQSVEIAVGGAEGELCRARRDLAIERGHRIRQRPRRILNRRVIRRFAKRKRPLGRQRRGRQDHRRGHGHRGAHYCWGMSSTFDTVIVSPFNSPVSRTGTAACFLRSAKSWFAICSGLSSLSTMNTNLPPPSTHASTQAGGSSGGKTTVDIFVWSAL